MKRKKKYQSFLDVGSAPIVDEKGDVIQIAAEPQPTTLAGFIAREEDKERQKQLAAQRAQADSARSEQSSRVREYWSQSVPELMASPVGIRDDVVGLQRGDSYSSAGQTFLIELENTGVTLSESGKNRLAAYCQSQWKHLGAAVTVANLRRAFERLKLLGVFADGEVTERIPEPVANPVDKRDREVRDILGDRRPNPEFENVELMWHQSVREQFGYNLSKLQHAEAWRRIESLNLDPLSPATWDSCRVNLVHRALAPSSLLTCRDVLQDQLRTGEIDAKTFVRRCETFRLENLLDKPRQYAAGS